jgi:ComF family protein
VYEGALRQSALALKRQPFLARRVVDLLAGISRQEPLQRSTLIVPVPLHRQRESSRGFNQAEVISSALSKSINLPVDRVSLVRTKHSEKYRAGLDAKGRRDTVENSFAVRYPRLVAGEDILLVDDVFTTGATVACCANALISAGAKDVFVLTIARAR